MRSSIRLSLLGIVVLAIFAETVSSVALLALGLWPKHGLREAYATYKADALSPDRVRLVPHPYFGFQRDTHVEGVNNFGFASKVDYPYAKSSDEYVIGIVGGSVAGMFARHAPDRGYLSDLATLVPKLKGKKIVILNLALPGGKQPQQFAISAYFMESLDLVLALDGPTEISGDRRYGAEFPIFYHYLYGSGAPGTIARAILASLRTLSSSLADVSLRFYPLTLSRTYFLLWKGVTIAAVELENSIIRRGKADGDPQHPVSNPEQFAANWDRYSRLEAAVAKTENRHAAFFLVPCFLTDPRSKNLTPAEQELFRARDHLPVDPSGFATMHRLASRMKSDGLAYFDLADVFRKIDDTVFLDGGCHLNQLGEDALARRITDDLAKNARSIF